MNKPKTTGVGVKDESILVVRRTDICSSALWTGYEKSDFKHELTQIQEKGLFMSRNVAELDPSYKQIIPYLIFRCGDQYFLMQRRKNATEQRLALKYTLGIGGHLRQEDLAGKTIFEWALREFHEEVDYAGQMTTQPLGIINDDATDVGKVHLGFAFLIEGDSPIITVKSELKSGVLVSAQDLKTIYYDSLETWSQIAFQLICDL